MNFTEFYSLIPVTGSPIFKIITAVGIVIFTAITIKVMTIYFRRSLKEKMNREHLEILLKVGSFSIILIVFLIFVLPAFGIQPSSFLVAGGVLGIILGFASQSIVSNLISGIFLMIERPIKIGDQVHIEDIFGFVEDINMMSTIIRTYEGLFVRIPNDKVFTTNITNYVGNAARRFEYIVGIRYSDAADEAIKIIGNVIEVHPFALKHPKPKVYVDNLGDNAVNIKVRIWAPSTEWFDVKMELLWIIKKTMEQNGIEIAFPQQTLWFANELKTQENKNPE